MGSYSDNFSSRELMLAMGKTNYFVVLLVLCVLNTSSAKEQNVYSYNATVLVRNRASDEGFSKWTIVGQLTIQDLEDYKIFKLDDLKTSIFNGLKTAKEPEVRNTIVDTKYITSPFAVYYNNIKDVEITIDSKEPEWSANIKRAIASVFNVDRTAKDGFQSIEHTIYGNCEINYEIHEEATKKYFEKVINQDNCTDSTNTNSKNVETIELNNNHKVNQYSNKRFYEFELNNGVIGKLQHVNAESNFTYQNMPTIRATHHAEQKQVFVLINSKPEEKFTSFEIPEESEKSSLFWKSADDEKSTKTQTEILKEYNDALRNFKTDFKKRPIENTNIGDWGSIDDIFDALSEMNHTGMAVLENQIKHEIENVHILMSMLPYIGTDASIDLIGKLVKYDEINDLLLIKLLATFPNYAQSPSQELLKKLKFLTHLKVSNRQVKYAGILSYATLVSESLKRGQVEEKYILNIIQKYYNHFIDSGDYEEQLTYLLGLINMGKIMNEELILQIITDYNIGNDLRTLAIFGFKKFLVNPEEEDVFKQVWPIVQNISEHFETRVASLDLLLSSNITEEQFNTIVNTYDKKPKNPYEEHMASYVFTTLQALENSTGYSNYLADFATARLKKGNIPRFTRSWTTGNYRLAFSDEDANFGSSLQTRVIGSPVTNGINIIHLSYDHFEMSVALESYTLYLKLRGVYETIYQGFLDSRSKSVKPISALIDLIKKCGYQMKNGGDVFVDLALFTEGKAIFGLHLNKDNIDTYFDNPLFLDLIKLLNYYQSISFPLMNYSKIPSDVGTDLEIAEVIEQVVYGETESDIMLRFFDDDMEVNELAYHYKSVYKYSSTVACSNPLAKADAVVYKFDINQKALDFPFKINSTSLAMSWRLKNNTFKWVSDSFLGTTLISSESNDENLKHFCPDCDEAFIIPIGDSKEKAFPLEELGISLYGSMADPSDAQKYLDNMEPDRKYSATAIQYNHNNNGFAFPPAKPVMYLMHFYYYLKTIKELNHFYLKVDPAFQIDYESVLEFEIDADDVTKNKDPLDGDKFHFIVKFNNIKSNGEILSGFNSTLKTITTTTFSGEQSKPQNEGNLAFYMNFFDFSKDEPSLNKICINHILLYPNQRSDKLSLKPIKPAKGKTTVAWGPVESLNHCPEKYIKFKELYTATDAKNRKVEESAEYKQCKNDSVGLKYVPPTEACIQAHEALSKYDIYGVYAEFSDSKPFIHLQTLMEKTKLGYKVFEYNHIDEGHLNISVSHAFADQYFGIVNTELLDYEENSAFYDYMCVDPTAVAYDDDDIYTGIESTCVITPTTLQTFTGIREPIFQESLGDVVAFVECLNDTRTGLTVQKINNKAVGFKFWSGDNTFIASADQAKLKVELNGRLVTQTPESQDEDIKIYFLEDDVIYVVDPVVEIYYTIEYISIKANTVYDKFICGECSYKQK